MAKERTVLMAENGCVASIKTETIGLGGVIKNNYLWLDGKWPVIEMQQLSNFVIEQCDVVENVDSPTDAKRWQKND